MSLYDIYGNELSLGGTGGSNVTETTLIGTLPQKIRKRNCYIKGSGTLTIQRDNLWNVSESSALVGNPTDVVWGDNSLTYTAGTNAMGVYGKVENLIIGQMYTLFVEFGENATSVRVYEDGFSDVTVQLNKSANVGYCHWVARNTTAKFAFGGTTGTSASFTNISLWEGRYTKVPNETDSFTLSSSYEYPTDAFMGCTLSSTASTSLYQYGNDGENVIGDDRGIILFGDSILDRRTDVAEYFRQRTGKSVLDCALGGTRMGSSRDSTNEYYPYDMTQVADSIASGDFSTQISGAKQEMYKVLQYGNIDEYKAIVLEYGTNDFTASASFNGADDTASIEGALTHIIDSILSVYPNIQIVVLSTLQFVSMGSGSQTSNHSDGTVWEMNEVMKGVCEDTPNCMPFVDMYHAFGENPTNRLTLTGDGVHLSNFGAERYKQLLLGKLIALGI